MKVVFLSYSDFKGGASMAAFSIFNAIENKKFFFLTVEKKYKKSKLIYSNIHKFYIFFLRILEKILILLFCKGKFHQSLNIFNAFIYKKIEKYHPDIINLHWINRSMISLSELNKFKTNIVISFHDMWYFNPTEHYFKKKFDKNSYLKNYCWKLKRKILYKKNVFFIVHNKWMFQELIKRHPKLKKKTYLVENYPIDTDTFKPRNKINLRKKYDLPLEKKIIFFSAQDITDERKGFKFFVRLIEKLSNNDNLFFLSLGKNEIKIKNYKNHKHISFISNEKSSELYSLSDIFLCTSTIDNLPLTLLEALSSGNLVISFNNGGSKNLLKNIGYVFEINKFNNLIRFLNKIENKLISEKSLLSRKFAKQYFDKRLIAQKYHSVFENIYKKN